MTTRDLSRYIHDLLKYIGVMISLLLLSQSVNGIILLITDGFNHVCLTMTIIFGIFAILVYGCSTCNPISRMPLYRRDTDLNNLGMSTLKMLKVITILEIVFLLFICAPVDYSEKYPGAEKYMRQELEFDANTFSVLRMFPRFYANKIYAVYQSWYEADVLNAKDLSETEHMLEADQIYAKYEEDLADYKLAYFLLVVMLVTTSIDHLTYKYIVSYLKYNNLYIKKKRR